MKKRLVSIVSILICLTLVIGIGYSVGDVNIIDDTTPLGSGASVIKETQDDLLVIPDKYNTGAKGDLTVVELNDNLGEIVLRAGNNNTTNTLDFYYRNKTVSGQVVFENYDFSKYPFALYNEDKITDRKIKLIFNNCKFAKFQTGTKESNISYEFNNCSFYGFVGSNSDFKQCRFGGSFEDGLRAFQNVHVKDCYFADMSGIVSTSKAVHIDGVQIYGDKDIITHDIVFENCRFEIPPINMEGSAATVNACIMIQLEYGNADGVQFKDCIANGGGYTIYAWDKNRNLNLQNIELSNIRVGCSKSFGMFYPVISPSVKIDNVYENSSLYVASVWKENGKTHFSVSNDTNQKRKLIIYTNKGEFTFDIPACLNGSQITAITKYDDMPFDIDITIDADVEFAVCYDSLYEGCATQIRYVNWGNEPVYQTKDMADRLFSGGEGVVYSGSCGKNAKYELLKNGTLVISGTGTTDGYHSLKPQPWVDFASLIQAVEVKPGIEALGSGMFANCTSIREIKLPDTLTAIGKRAFYGCSSIYSVSLPASVVEIGDNALPYVTIKEVQYEGESLANINLVGASALYSDKFTIATSEPEVQLKVLAEGSCGKNTEYVLTEDGMLRISGAGATDDFHSLKPVPWAAQKDLIKEVYIEEGITRIGNQLFSKTANLESVYISDGVKEIGVNAFMSCKNLKVIDVPSSVIAIEKRAFSNTNIATFLYEGRSSQWAKIKIGDFNTEIDGKVLFIIN